ncbi:MAG: methionine adenosyltransferase [Deltaproteobacteria bacterium]|jgi:S-adenosylmethionine synthetase|nr:methionine adenosyltransferase [Deltaproteobacteria bacterium]
MEYLATAESVTEGHPDKICDQISDGILDACLEQDPFARVAAETMVSGNTVFIAGEITSSALLSIEATARRVIRDIGYIRPELGFDADTCFIVTSVHAQSPDIARGVSRGEVTGAGDQGVFYGYACDETPSLMPCPAFQAHALARRLTSARKSGALPWLRPDGKTQVTVRYGSDGRPAGLVSIVVAAQHDPDISQETLARGIAEQVIIPVLPATWLAPDTRILVNPTGRFVEGGPAADTGLTGRKIMVDTYGGCARHGGGAFSGKDATKVDRTAAYMARYIAKNVVAAGLAAQCEVAMAFAIGRPLPEMLTVTTFGTEKAEIRAIRDAVKRSFPLSVAGMIARLDLRRPVFRQTAAYGHFGREEPLFAWERTDTAETLRSQCLA